LLLYASIIEEGVVLENIEKKYKTLNLLKKYTKNSFFPS
jgi:hypothetical protein